MRNDGERQDLTRIWTAITPMFADLLRGQRRLRWPLTVSRFFVQRPRDAWAFGRRSISPLARGETFVPSSDPEVPSGSAAFFPLRLRGPSPLGAGSPAATTDGFGYVGIGRISRIDPEPAYRGSATSRVLVVDCLRKQMPPGAAHQEREDPYGVVGRFNAHGANPRTSASSVLIRVRSCRFRSRRERLRGSLMGRLTICLKGIRKSSLVRVVQPPACESGRP